jgi:hypothetical protein
LDAAVEAGLYAAGYGVVVRQEGLLFREKEAKSFCLGCRGLIGEFRVSVCKSFLVLFFKKELLSSAYLVR